MQKSAVFALKGHILHTPGPENMEVFSDSYLVCEEGFCKGIFSELPASYNNIPVYDYTGNLIIPGFTDLHLHAPQYPFRGLGMDLELLEWLETNAFPEEEKYSEPDYAGQAYELFVKDLRASGTARAVMFSTLHVESTLLLMDLLEDSGLRTFAGKVNMDRNCRATLCENSAEASLADTARWLDICSGRYTHTKPILTPRFVPTCSDALLKGLGEIQKAHPGLAVQSHLSENLSEIEWVQELVPQCDGYADAYRLFGLLGGDCGPAIMAHCNYLRPDEIELLVNNGVYMAHCPQSNTNLSSGIAPVRRFLNAGMKIGLGSDIAGGHTLSVFRCISDAVQMSKLYWRLIDQSMPALSLSEAFYLATKGGGSFFGKAGSFETGYEFDALVLDDTSLPTTLWLTPGQRLERMIYLEGKNMVKHKYVAGERLF